MTIKELSRLNLKFLSHFGSIDGTYPRFAWKRTIDLYSEVDGEKLPHSVALGDTWVVAQYRPPDGYQPIYGSELLENLVPDDQITSLAIAKIQDQIESAAQGRTAATLQAKLDKKEADKRQQVSDMVDSDWPAFDGCPDVPGFRKLNTSFPTPQSEICKPNAEELRKYGN